MSWVLFNRRTIHHHLSCWKNVTPYYKRSLPQPIPITRPISNQLLPSRLIPLSIPKKHATTIKLDIRFKSNESETRVKQLQTNNTNEGGKSKLKERIGPYLALSRVEAPTGAILLFLPCGSSLTLAASSCNCDIKVLLYQTFLFGMGAFVMRGAGCTINDLWDRSIDRKVSRTRLRPLASGALSVPNAFVWLAFQLSIGLLILLQLNSFSIALGASSLALVFVYPLMKRVTYWPQFVLGLAFNWGALLGSSAILGQTDWKVSIPLYIGHVCWTIVYDTIYAEQDKKWDLKVGVKSTAILFGDQTVAILGGFSTAFVGFTALTGYLNGCGIPFYFLAVIAPAFHLYHLLSNLNIASPDLCRKSFNHTAVSGALVWLGSLVDYFFRTGLF